MPDTLEEAIREFKGNTPWLGGYATRLRAIAEEQKQPIQTRGEFVEPAEPVKPGWKTSEFYVAMGASIIGVLVLLGWLTPAEQVTANQWIKALSDNIAGAIIVIGAVWRFIQSRTQVKAAAQNAKAAESNLMAANENRHAAEATARSMTRAMALVLIGLFAFAGAAPAGEIKLAPGTWSGTIPATKVTILVDATGKQTVIIDPSTPLTITGGGGGPVPPLEPPGPTVGLEASAARLTKEAINAGGTPTTAAGISSAYTMVGESVGRAEITPESALPAVNFLLDGLLATQPDKAKWDAFRTGLGLEFDRLRQDGVLKTKEQYVKAFTDVSKGINGVIKFNGSLTAPAQQINADAGILDKIDIAKLMELIKFLFELWKLFSAAKVGYVISVMSLMA